MLRRQIHDQWIWYPHERKMRPSYSRCGDGGRHRILMMASLLLEKEIRFYRGVGGHVETKHAHGGKGGWQPRV